MRHCLIIANLTLCGPHLLDLVRERLEQGEWAFHVLVPASQPALAGSWDQYGDREAAAQRLSDMLEALRELGAQAEGEIGDFRALDAAMDALRDTDYDEVVVSTLPPGASRWLRMDFVSRLERALGHPVTHVVAESAEVS
jgi:hypothetical protein